MTGPATSPIDDEAKMSAMMAAVDIAVKAAKASAELRAAGEGTCEACGGTFGYIASVPKRRRAFVQIACRSGCFSMIT